jgi:hypothetical protein
LADAARPRTTSASASLTRRRSTTSSTHQPIQPESAIPALTGRRFPLAHCYPKMADSEPRQYRQSPPPFAFPHHGRGWPRFRRRSCWNARRGRLHCDPLRNAMQSAAPRRSDPHPDRTSTNRNLV